MADTIYIIGIAKGPWIVSGGPYRLVLHPTYLGYLATHVGILLTNWSHWNTTIYIFIIIYFFQISRILAEERILSEDESYGAYHHRVRYRMIPLVF